MVGGGEGDVGDVLRTGKAGVCLLNPIPFRGCLNTADVGRQTGNRGQDDGNDFREKSTFDSATPFAIRLSELHCELAS